MGTSCPPPGRPPGPPGDTHRAGALGVSWQPHPGSPAAAAEGGRVGARSPPPARDGRFLEPVPPAPSGLFWLPTGELRRVKLGGITPPESVRCAHRSASRDWRVGRWGASLGGHLWQPGPRPDDRGPQHSNKSRSQLGPHTVMGSAPRPAAPPQKPWAPSSRDRTSHESSGGTSGKPGQHFPKPSCHRRRGEAEKPSPTGA